MANRNFLSNKLYQLEAYPVLLSCNFVVDSTNGNGLGIRSLKGPGIKSVFMLSSASFTGSTHTSTLVDSISPVTSSWAVLGMPVQGSGIPVGSVISQIVSSTSIRISKAATTSVSGGTITYQGVGSPNPEAGLIMVQLQDNYSRYLGGFSGFVSYVDGSAQTSTTAGRASVIVSLGTATAAQSLSDFAAVGFPAGGVPAVGASFVANVSAAIGHSAAVMRPLASGILTMEIAGDPNKTLSLGNSLVNGGGIILVQTLAPTLSSTTVHNNPMIRTAPLDGSVCGLSFYLSNSSVTVQGQ
jgi:hypothetical protein